MRSGLGYRKSAADYGAFPADAYSHTPGEGGAQQPGMTGQVKEEILTRWGELGLRVRDGRIQFDPVLLDEAEIARGGALSRSLGPLQLTALLTREQTRDRAGRPTTETRAAALVQLRF